MGAFGGVYAAMLTPFDGEGAVSEDRVAAYCRFLVGLGVEGLFCCGTTGEWPLLRGGERMAVAYSVVAAARAQARGVKVIVHAGANSTAQAGRLAAAAREAGADAASLICPPYYPLDDEALLAHFSAASREARDLPVFVYSIPGMTRSDVSPALLLRICREAPNVVGLKYSGGDLARFREYRRVMGPSFSLFIGDDGLALPALREGADGIVSGNASAVPDILAALYAAFAAGEVRGAEAAQADLDAFIAAMDQSAELSSFKAIVSLRGTEVGEVRAPLKRLPPGGRERLAALVRGLEDRGTIRRVS